MNRLQRGAVVRWSAPVLVAVALAIAALAPAVSARSHHRTRPPRLPGLRSMVLGMVDYPVFTDPHSSTRAYWLGQAKALGARWVRLAATWSTIAPLHPTSSFDPRNPASPQYGFAALDAQVRSVAAQGLNIMLLADTAPTWAEGPGWQSAQPGTWEPHPQAFANFGHALAVRYSGKFPDPLNPGRTLPRVKYFQAWNEPNLPTSLGPQWGRASNGSIVPLSPIIYRSLLNAFYAAVKQVQPDSSVFEAGTAPFGDPPAQGRQRMAPELFLENLFCLNSAFQRASSCSGGPPHLDGLDHHIYSPPLYHAKNPGDIAVPDLGKIWKVLHAAQHAGTALPAGPKPLWITEIGWQSTPPNPATYAGQAHYLALDFYEFWTEHVSTAFWFLIRDPNVPSSNFIANGGLFFMNNHPKPAAADYRFPFVAVPGPHGSFKIWGLAPKTGTVLIQKHVGKGWNTVLRVKTTSSGVFYTLGKKLGHRPLLRASINGSISPPWTGGF